MAGVDLLKAQKAARERSERKRGHALHRSFFSWFMENNDPANDDIAEVSTHFITFHPICT